MCERVIDGTPCGEHRDAHADLRCPRDLSRRYQAHKKCMSRASSSFSAEEVDALEHLLAALRSGDVGRIKLAARHQAISGIAVKAHRMRAKISAQGGPARKETAA